MPLNAKGNAIKAAMTKPPAKGGYGKRGENVLYASINAGKIKGAEKSGGKKKGAKR